MRISMKGINKSFGGNPVLRNAQFDLADGEIHALVGENGAGKSTLMKILTGVYKRDSGEIFVDGKPVNFSHPKEAEASGIVFIYQEINAMPDLSVTENMFIGREIQNRFGVLDQAEMERQSRQIFQRLGVQIPVKKTMGELSIGQQQMVEIARALMVNAKVLILDEPTAAMTLEETKILFHILGDLKKKGVSSIYISHRLEEIFEICDRVTVLRDGQYIGTNRITETDMNNLIKMMIGREIGERFPVRHCKIGKTVLQVKNLTHKGIFQDVSFNVRAGEVLGVSGLMGAGRTEIMQAIFGYLPHDSGNLYVLGKRVEIHSPEQAKKLGIGFITEDRKTEGLMLQDTIQKNIGLPNLERISQHGVLDAKKDAKMVQSAIRDLSIRCSGPTEMCENLSGGNQQKVVFAKWIFINPKILILDEPTRGVDIGAKIEIYNIINRLAENGVAIIMVSSELPEIIGMSDRVMVVHEGRIAGILDNLSGDNSSDHQKVMQENIMILATGGKLE